MHYCETHVALITSSKYNQDVHTALHAPVQCAAQITFNIHSTYQTL